jgi:hypothetical protein
MFCTPFTIPAGALALFCCYIQFILIFSTAILRPGICYAFIEGLPAPRFYLCHRPFYYPIRLVVTAAVVNPRPFTVRLDPADLH